MFDVGIYVLFYGVYPKEDDSFRSPSSPTAFTMGLYIKGSHMLVFTLEALYS